MCGEVRGRRPSRRSFQPFSLNELWNGTLRQCYWYRMSRNSYPRGIMRTKDRKDGRQSFRVHHDCVQSPTTSQVLEQTLPPCRINSATLPGMKSRAAGRLGLSWYSRYTTNSQTHSCPHRRHTSS